MDNDLIILFEIIAMLATILTIVYLANQIRLSNKLALSSIEHQLNSRVYDRRFITARDNDFCEFFSRDWANEDLTKVERVKVSQFVTMLIIDARKSFCRINLGL